MTPMHLSATSASSPERHGAPERGLHAERARQAVSTASTPGVRKPSMPAQQPRDTTQATFSPESLRLLNDVSLSAAGAAREVVEDAAQLASAGVRRLGGAIDAVGQGAEQVVLAAAEGVQAGAHALADTIASARGGVLRVADGLEQAIEGSAEELGDVVETVVGFGALAALAGGMVLNEVA